MHATRRVAGGDLAASVRVNGEDEIAERTARLLGPAADRAAVRLEYRLDPSVPPVRADGDLIGQALMNLAVNGVQATPPKGR